MTNATAAAAHALLAVADDPISDLTDVAHACIAFRAVVTTTHEHPTIPQLIQRAREIVAPPVFTAAEIEILEDALSEYTKDAYGYGNEEGAYTPEQWTKMQLLMAKLSRLA